MALEIIDLRSDTVTQPSKEMRICMYKAEVGDNFYKEDAITQELEEYCAQYFGKEAALFNVSGTMSNQIALKTYIQPGNEIILDSSYHINYYEYSPVSGLIGGVFNLLSTSNGIIRELDLLNALKNRHRSPLTGDPKLLCLENTINFYAGKIYPLEIFQKVCSLAKEKGLHIYLDGARLLNACTISKTSVLEYTSHVDSLMISFSKGLGAPIGSMLMGSHDFINQARKYQKWFGGGLHQSGIIAAACLYAIKHNIPNLIDDNFKARLLADLLVHDQRINLNFKKIETNIVMFSLRSAKNNTQKFIELAKKQGILLYHWNHDTIRAVTHSDTSVNQIRSAAKVILKVVSLCS